MQSQEISILVILEQRKALQISRFGQADPRNGDMVRALGLVAARAKKDGKKQYQSSTSDQLFPISFYTVR